MGQHSFGTTCLASQRMAVASIMGLNSRDDQKQDTTDTAAKTANPPADEPVSEQEPPQEAHAEEDEASLMQDELFLMVTQLQWE